MTHRLAKQWESDDEDDSEDGFKFVTPRIKDFASGLDGIIKGLLSRNPDKLLEGSFEFIPSDVRVGVKGILSSIAGRPVAQTATSPKPTTTKSVLKGGQSPVTSELAPDSEEEISAETEAESE